MGADAKEFEGIIQKRGPLPSEFKTAKWSIKCTKANLELLNGKIDANETVLDKTTNELDLTFLLNRKEIKSPLINLVIGDKPPFTGEDAKKLLEAFVETDEELHSSLRALEKKERETSAA